MSACYDAAFVCFGTCKGTERRNRYFSAAGRILHLNNAYGRVKSPSSPVRLGRTRFPPNRKARNIFANDCERG